MRKHELVAELDRVNQAFAQDQALNATLTAVRDARIAELTAENAILKQRLDIRSQLIDDISDLISDYRLDNIASGTDDDNDPEIVNIAIDPGAVTARLNPNPLPITAKRAYEVARWFGWSNSELFAAARELALAHIVEERDWVTANEAAQLNDHIKAKSTKED